MKERFREHRFSRNKQLLLEKITAIIEEYQQQGIKMTLRQLYYQLVARGIISNKPTEYKKLGSLLTDARYAGIVDWEAIEDRARVPKMPSEWENVAELIAAAKQSYRLPRWEGQDYYIELFTEKDALSSVLAPIAEKWHIHFCVNRGYTSATAMYDLGKRVSAQLNQGRKVVVLYLGDHDPSGLDMVRDIRVRLAEFTGEDVEIKAIALTQEQIQTYAPPPNPAKTTDTRAKAYIEKYGATSWEVDALPPEVMNELVNEAIGAFVDVEKMNEIIEQEKLDINDLLAGLNG